jgi:predicted TIM-barrel fold metal-dependent hydrolase
MADFADKCGRSRVASVAFTTGLFLAAFILVELLTPFGRASRFRTNGLMNRLRLAEFGAVDPVDMHTHVFETGPAFVDMLQRLHLSMLDIVYGDDTDPARKSLPKLKDSARRFVASSPNRAKLCTSFDPFEFNSPDFPVRQIEEIGRDIDAGAVAVKVWKNLGMEIRNGSGQRVLPDDPSLQPIYRYLARRGVPLIAHFADPDLAWQPKGTNGRYYLDHPQWDMLAVADAPSKEAILQARDHVLASYPDLKVIGAHFGSMEDHLDQVAAHLDRYPNFAVDTSARVSRLLGHPTSEVRDFIVKYQDRILYGSDLNFEAGANDESEMRTWENQYLLDWRYFATNDFFDYHGRRAEGLNLPDPVLKKLFHDNAVRWIPGLSHVSH